MAASRKQAPGKAFITSRTPFAASTANKSGGTFTLKGIDTVDSRLLAVDAGAGQLKQSTDWATTWSTSKGLPSNVAWYDVGPIIRFGSYLYLIAYDGTATRAGVYRAAPASGNTAFTWSSQLVTFAAGAAIYTVTLAADSSYIYAAEYGDPTGGPTLYRSSDGTSWDAVFNDSNMRHIHCVETDPYNAGHVWMACGDGVGARSIKYSTDYGTNWTNIPQQSSYTPQCVQISFSPEWVWLAADSEYATAVVIDRATKKWRYASTNYHAHIAIPGDNTGITFPVNCVTGCVDPSTGIYYCGAATGGSNTVAGLFYIDSAGGKVELLTQGEQPSKFFVANGKVWFGAFNRRLITKEDQ